MTENILHVTHTVLHAIGGTLKYTNATRKSSCDMKNTSCDKRRLKDENIMKKETILFLLIHVGYENENIVNKRNNTS